VRSYGQDNGVARHEPEKSKPSLAAESDEVVRAAGDIGMTIFHRSAPAGWGAMRWPSSTSGCACVASPPCVSSLEERAAKRSAA
jgi:hypothetical protein